MSLGILNEQIIELIDNRARIDLSAQLSVFEKNVSSCFWCKTDLKDITD